MKSTGIVRRVDDLGRVVIPKEIRRTLGIHEGEFLEIYTDTICGHPAVCFAKYEVNLTGETKVLRERVEDHLDPNHPRRKEILKRLEEIRQMLDEKTS
jgi:AbrB family looped-hinge helix DNA binding protein